MLLTPFAADATDDLTVKVHCKELQGMHTMGFLFSSRLMRTMQSYALKGLPWKMMPI